MDLSTASLFICRWKKLVDRDHIGESRYYSMKAKRSRRRTFWTLRAHDRLSQQRMASVAFTPRAVGRTENMGGKYVVMWWPLLMVEVGLTQLSKSAGPVPPSPPGSDRPAVLRQWLTLRFIKWYLWTTIKWIIGTLSTITPWLMVGLTDYGRSVRKSPSLNGQKLNPSPKLFGMTEAYFVCHISPKF